MARPATDSHASRDKPVVGWREWASLPALGLGPIKAKIDTGARTSSLHAFAIDPFSRAGRPWLRFGIHPLQQDSSQVHWCEASVVDRRWVSDSGGHRQFRYVIETVLALGERRWSVELTLADRDSMSFRLLLGRSALTGVYLVDPSRSYCLGKKVGV